MIAVEGSHRQDAILELAQVREAKQEERCTMDEKSKEAEYWRLTAKGVYDEYLEEMRELQGQLKDREATLKQEESFVRHLFVNSMLTMRNYEHSRSWKHRKPLAVKMDIVNF